MTTDTTITPQTLDEILPDAMRDEAAWQRLVTQLGATTVRASLIRLRADVKQQRTINAGLADAGDIPRPEYSRWLAKVTGFDRALTRRMTELQVNPTAPDGNRPAEQTNAYYRRRHVADRNLITVLAMAMHRYLEDDDLGEEVLEDALDSLMDFGTKGQHSVADAIGQGLIGQDEPGLTA